MSSLYWTLVSVAIWLGATIFVFKAIDIVRKNQKNKKRDEKQK